MNSRNLYNEIRKYCEENADATAAQKYARYFKSGYNGYGLSAAQVRGKARELLKSNELDLQQTLDAFVLAAEDANYDIISIMLIIVDGMGKQYDRRTFGIISGWFAISIDNWAHADILGTTILPKFFRKSLANIDDYKSWVSSPFKFQRRCVPVTFIKLLKNTTNFEEYLDLIVPLMTDPDREVHQGTGWFLREAWKIRKEETESFLMKYKDISPRLIFQIACEKMSPEEKIRFRKQKPQTSGKK